MDEMADTEDRGPQPLPLTREPPPPPGWVDPWDDPMESAAWLSRVVPDSTGRKGDR